MNPLSDKMVFFGFFLIILVNVLTLRLIRYTFRHHDDGLRDDDEDD